MTGDKGQMTLHKEEEKVEPEKDEEKREKAEEASR